MSKKTAKHRVKMVVEIEFGWHDEVDFALDKKFATKKDVVQELTNDLKRDGLIQFVNLCDHNLKTKLKSISFVKFDK